MIERLVKIQEPSIANNNSLRLTNRHVPADGSGSLDQRLGDGTHFPGFTGNTSRKPENGDSHHRSIDQRQRRWSIHRHFQHGTMTISCLQTVQKIVLLYNITKADPEVGIDDFI